MATKDERIDAYIEKAKPFAQPLLKHFRKLVHKAAPDVTETLKWGMPHFEMEGPLCWMASFKEHAAFGFWKAELMQDPDEVFTITEKKAMGQFGRIAKKSELPKDTVILGFIKQGVELNRQGIKVPSKPTPKPTLPVELAAAFKLKKNAKAKKAFDAMAPSHQREYCLWIDEAKRQETKDKRLATTLEWLAEGKKRNWKYEKC